MIDLSLNFITSSKGHYGYTEVYKKTITDLFSKSEILKNCFKVAHIKVRPGEEEIFRSMKAWLESRGFEVIHTLKHWSHKAGDLSGQIGRLEDHNTLLAHSAIRNYFKFGFSLEDDFIFHNNIDEDIEEAIFQLSNNPSHLSFKWSRIDDLEANKKSNCDLVDSTNNLYVHDLDWSFNPHFAPNLDHYYISKFSLLSYPQLHPQCEAAYRLAANYFKQVEKPFILKYNQAVEHIGWESNIKKFIEEDNLKENITYESSR